ncbi:RNA-directed DNA polymerase, eukaryota [Tanacetum coccineum]
MLGAAISYMMEQGESIEEHLLADLTSLMDSVTLSNSGDRWVCDLVSDGNFRVKEIRNYIDDLFLPHQAAQTRWIKYIPIKVNIFAWRARQDCLPTRVNLIRRGITIESSLCPVCSVCEEDVCHIFFRCDLAQLVLRRICRWWGLDPHDWSSFQEWQSWILSIQFSSKDDHHDISPKDLLSRFSDDELISILSCMPIKDAAVTSKLAKKWSIKALALKSLRFVSLWARILKVQLASGMSFIFPKRLRPCSTCAAGTCNMWDDGVKYNVTWSQLDSNHPFYDIRADIGAVIRAAMGHNMMGGADVELMVTEQPH